MAKPRYQPGPAGRVRTMELVLSVTDANVWPGSSSGAALRGDGGFSCALIASASFRRRTSRAQDWDCAPPHDNSCPAASSIPQGAGNYAARLLTCPRVGPAL